MQYNNIEIKKICNKELTKVSKDIEDIFEHKSLTYVSKIIDFKFISCYNNNFLNFYFKIKTNLKINYKKIL